MRGIPDRHGAEGLPGFEVGGGFDGVGFITFAFDRDDGQAVALAEGDFSFLADACHGDFGSSGLGVGEGFSFELDEGIEGGFREAEASGGVGGEEGVGGLSDDLEEEAALFEADLHFECSAGMEVVTDPVAKGGFRDAERGVDGGEALFRGEAAEAEIDNAERGMAAIVGEDGDAGLGGWFEADKGGGSLGVAAVLDDAETVPKPPGEALIILSGGDVVVLGVGEVEGRGDGAGLEAELVDEVIAEIEGAGLEGSGGGEAGHFELGTHDDSVVAGSAAALLFFVEGDAGVVHVHLVEDPGF